MNIILSENTAVV